MRTEYDGAESIEEERFGIKIHTVHVTNETAAKALSRKIGTYITLSLPCQIQYITEIYSIGECLASVLKERFQPYEGKKLCICGIGASQITMDSLGPSVVKKLSLESFSIIPEEYSYFRKVYGAIPEVSYYSNFPTERTVAGIVKEMQADCLLLIDSLVANEYESLYSTIQFSEGSGLTRFHSQSFPDWEAGGIPVMSLGIPMGIKASKGFETAKEKEVLISECISEIIEKASTIIAYALIRTCCPALSPEGAYTVLSQQMILRDSAEENDEDE